MLDAENMHRRDMFITAGTRKTVSHEALKGRMASLN